jgi:phage terminase large subunit
VKALRIQTPRGVRAAAPASARYKAAHGGRGSGKTHFFGELAIDDAVRFPGDYGLGFEWSACERSKRI